MQTISNKLIWCRNVNDFQINFGKVGGVSSDLKVQIEPLIQGAFLKLFPPKNF